MTAPELASGLESSAVNQVLEAARAAFDARRLELLDRAARIRAATDAYAEAAEVALVADLARKLGLESPVAESVEGAAQSLRDIVLDLPELKETEPHGLPLERVTPNPPAVVPMRTNLEYETSPEAKALLNELKSLDFEAMSVPLFKATAAELAARAHMLNNVGDLAQDIPGRVINTLNAIRSTRGITGIYGLAHRHEGHWPELARKAKAERERLQNGSAGLTQKLQIPAAILAKVAEEAPSASGENEDDAQVASFPRLQVAAQSGPIVLVGGLVVNEKLDRIKKRYGFVPEWIETDGTVKGVQSLERRILDRRITAVVILEGLGGHKHFEPIVAATRQTGTPLVYGDTAGSGSLRKAFGEIEGRLLSAK